jgi:tol-pal system protein YbgF
MPLRWAVGPVVVIALTGCITVPEFRALQREVAGLKRSSQDTPDQETRLAELGAELAELRETMGHLEDTIDELRNELLRATADTRVTGPNASAPTTGGTESGEPVAGEPSGNGNPGGAAPLGVTGSAPAGNLGAEVSSYEEAFRVYRAGQYNEAVQLFDRFLEQYQGSDYADNALYWRAECYFKLEDYERAAVAFEEVVRRYPDGNKVPEALYRQGIALLKIGESAGDVAYRSVARQIFERIVAEYAESEQAPQARRQLETLKR